jgi:hypothetical protein
VVFVVGCADPCFDDGLAQGGCPERGTDTTDDGPDGTQTEGATGPTMSGGMDATTPADDTQGSGGAEGAECPELDEVLLPQVPTFQLVVDQSGSMNEDFGGGVSRWDAMRTTLVDPTDGVVAQLQSSIRFGLSLYSTGEMNECPQVSSFPAQLDALDEITAVLEVQEPLGQTPTGESLELIVADLVADTWEGEKIMVLTTDGEPDTCAIPDPEGADVDAVRQVAVDAVTAAYGMGIRTFVISVGTEIGEDHLQALANAGVGNDAGDPDAEFWVANDTQALVDAFNAIVDGVRPCDFPLSKPLTAELAPSCEVTVNDGPVPYDDPNGWVLDGETTLELQGDACSALQEGVATVQLNCTCVPQ